MPLYRLSVTLILLAYTCYAEKPQPKYGTLPLLFERNQGQADAQARFLARGRNYVVALTPQGVAIRLQGAADRTVRMEFAGGLMNSTFEASETSPGVTNYLIGTDPRAWIQSVPHYGRVVQRRAYPGIDIAYYGKEGQLEYDFLFQPGADPDQVRLHVTGAGKLKLDSNGDLLLDVNGSKLRQKLPVAYQEREGRRTPVNARYRLLAGNMVGLAVTGYDRKLPLVVDPVLTLSYSTYLGGAGPDEGGTGIAVDANGNVWVAGYTSSTNFPLASPWQGAKSGGTDAFVAKFDPTGTILLVSTYLGGSSTDQATAIALDPAGNAYIAGVTTSTNFPTLNPLQSAHGGTLDGFAAKFSSTGTLIYATYLGGSGIDRATGIAVDSSGAAYVTGGTDSPNFPLANAQQAFNHGGQDAFVSKLNAAGTALVYSTYLGGFKDDQASAIAVDAVGGAYVAGNTRSDDFPLSFPFQTSGTAFVTKLNANGVAVYSTYLGTAAIAANAIALDATGSAYIAGNGHVSKLNAAGTALSYTNSSFGGVGIAVDSSGQAYVSGSAFSASFPVLDPLKGWAGNGEGYVVKFAADGTPIYSTLIGGLGPDSATAIAVDGSGAAYITGTTVSSDFPVHNPFQATKGSDGGNTAFLAKLTFSTTPDVRVFFGTNPSPQRAQFNISGQGCSPGNYTAAVVPAASLGPDVVYEGTPLIFQPAASCTVSVPPIFLPNGFRFTFVSWGDGATANPRVFAAPAHGAGYTINIKQQYLLTTSVSPAGGGTVNVFPASPDGYYDPGTAVRISAVANPGTAFSNFTGGLFGSNNVQTLVMNFPQSVTANFAPGFTVSGQVTSNGVGLPGITVNVSGGATLTATTDASGNYSVALPAGTYTISPLLPGYNFVAPVTLTNLNANQTVNFSATPEAGLLFYPLTPCRIADTRSNAGFTGAFGPPILAAGTTRNFNPVGTCGIPATAVAYSLNFTVVPNGPLGNLTVYPAGQPQPNASTLNNSLAGILANAAIVPAGVGGAISVFATDTTNVLFDVNGYFAPPTATGLAFYPVTPCRVADTRAAAGFTGTYGPPSLTQFGTRTFNIPASSCATPASASAYSLNFTVVPPQRFGNLTIWPTGLVMPLASTLNGSLGTTLANAAIVPAGQNGNINASMTDGSTDLLFDINGYFAPLTASGLKFYPMTPCRVADTRALAGFSGAYGPPSMTAGSTRTFNLATSPCNVPPSAAAYSLNFTVVPSGPLGNLTTWPAGQPMPVVSTLNDLLGTVLANAAIVPAGPNSSINVFVTHATEVLFDIDGYFAQ